MAGRIPESFIQDLLARTDIVQVIGERIDLKKKGREYVALSPFTNEKTPSFTVSPTKQFYHCFSSGKHGTAISFLMEHERLTFPEAIEELAKKAGLEVPREGGRGAPAPVLDGPLDALALAQRHFQAELKKSKAAVEYLKGRGVSGETAKTFGIGYAPESWDALARQFPDPKHALTAGLLIERDRGGVYDRFRHRVMFPIRDPRGRIIGFGGRTLGDDPAKYLNSPETPLFHKGRNLYGLYESRESDARDDHLIVVEGYMDVVMLAQHGIGNAVATLGTATTREHLQVLFRAAPKVVFCFDGDRAGRNAAWRALEQTLPELQDGRECRFLFMPEGQDPDDVVRAEGADAFRARVEAAVPLTTFLIDTLRKGADLSTPDGRAKLAARARPHLARMRQGALRMGLADELASLARLSRADFEAAAPAQAPAESYGEDRSGTASVAGLSRRPVSRALQLLLNFPVLAGQVDPEALAGAKLPGVDLLDDAIAYFREHPEAAAAQWLERWREDERFDGVNRLVARRVEGGEDALAGEFRDAIDHIVRRRLDARGAELVEKLDREKSLSPEEMRELDQISRQRHRQPPA